MKKNQKTQDQSAEELKTQYHDLSKEIYQLKNELAVSRKLEKPHQLRKIKKDRARALTFLRQKTGNLSL